jgi:hypothetical protein
VCWVFFFSGEAFFFGHHHTPTHSTPVPWALYRLVSALLPNEVVLVLLVAEVFPDGMADSAREASFQLLFIPVFLPILLKLYDGVIVSFIVNCCRKKFDLSAAVVPVTVTPSFF